MDYTPTRQWSYRNGRQRPILVVLTDEQALCRLAQLEPNQKLTPLDPEPLLALVRKPS